MAGTNSRAYRMVEACKIDETKKSVEKELKDDQTALPKNTFINMDFWKKKKSNNWFCNRPLSPTPDHTEKIPKSNSTSTKINIIQNIVLQSPLKMANNSCNKAETQTVFNNLNREQMSQDAWQPIVLVKKLVQNEEVDQCCSDDAEKSFRQNFDVESVANTTVSIRSSKDLETSSKFDHMSSSEEDPFACSNDEDSTYFPSDEEDTSFEKGNRFIQGSSSDSDDDYLIKLRSERIGRQKSTSKTKLIQSSSTNVGYPSEEKTEKDTSLEQEPVIDMHFIQNGSNNSVNSPSRNGSNSSVNSLNRETNEAASFEKCCKKYKRKPDFCYFCETTVNNFARHVIRNHASENEVVVLSLQPPKSAERRKLLDVLRRKGNYLKNADVGVKPVRQSYMPNQRILPCENCLGFFSAKSLYRHRKKCGDGNSSHAQAAGQSKLAYKIKVDETLKTQVFPRMRADKVSLEAKKDFIICAFGARYLKTHREKHFINVTSRKMRELSRLLIELKQKEPKIDSLFEALQPQYFDVIVAATKIVAKYNPQKEIYESPTLAMNMATSLKQCCDIAITLVIKRQQNYANLTWAEAESKLKTMIHLFNSNWQFEISSHAASNLNLNKWNKITIVPLAQDLKKLRDYILKVADKSEQSLKRNENDTSAFNTLMETVYCRVILLNRRRPGELQRMYLHTYVTSGNDKQFYQEFNDAITPTEQVLLQKLKRVVIRGKRGRGVPVLFSHDIQKHLEFLIELRKNFVPEENLYLFAKAGLTTPIVGYKVLSKYAKDSGTQNPSAITATRLRKHLATLSQIFNLSEGEVEQLANFMGHTSSVHRNSYRLPDDIYQTAKISKVLLLMEKGDLGQYKGQNLDEIDINLDEDLLTKQESSGESDVEVEDEITSEKLANFIAEPSTSNAKGSEAVIPKIGKKRTLVPWTAVQKEVAKDFFKKHIKNKKPPKRFECEELIEKRPDIFSNKNWLKIKVFIQNEYKKKT